MFLYPSQAYSSFEEKEVNCPYCNDTVYLQTSNLEEDQHGNLYIVGELCCDELQGQLFYDNIHEPEIEIVSKKEAIEIMKKYLNSPTAKFTSFKLEDFTVSERNEGVFFQHNKENDYFTFFIRRDKSFNGSPIMIDIQAKHREDMDFVLLESCSLDEIWEELY